MMKMNEEDEKLENFDRKVVQVFQEELPEMPELAEVEELELETLERLQAAGDSALATDIVRFLKK